MAQRKTKKKRRIPKTWMVRDKPPGRTTFLQSKTTGRMKGRKYVKDVRRSDKTVPIRVCKGSSKGWIMGRSKAFPVKGSSKRGTTRTLRVRL